MAMLDSASDARFADLENANLALTTVIFGTVRSAFERNLSETAADALRRQLIAMCRAYAKAAAR